MILSSCGTVTPVANEQAVNVANEAITTIDETIKAIDEIDYSQLHKFQPIPILESGKIEIVMPNIEILLKNYNACVLQNNMLIDRLQKK